MLAALRRRVQQVGSPSSRFSVWTTQLRKNVAAVATVSDLTGMAMEPRLTAPIAV